MPETYDFIVIGSGPGGSTVAYRLGELADAKILVLEVGTGDLPEAVSVPWRWNELLLTDLDWAYNSAPQPGLNGRRVYSAAGRCTGGGSAVYHMMHVRAKPANSTPGRTTAAPAGRSPSACRSTSARRTSSTT